MKTPEEFEIISEIVASLAESTTKKSKSVHNSSSSQMGSEADCAQSNDDDRYKIYIDVAQEEYQKISGS